MYISKFKVFDAIVENGMNQHIFESLTDDKSSFNQVLVWCWSGDKDYMTQGWPLKHIYGVICLQKVEETWIFILISQFDTSQDLRFRVSFCFQLPEIINCQTSNISYTSVGNKIVDHSDVVGASPVGAAPTTSSFSV